MGWDITGGDGADILSPGSVSGDGVAFDLMGNDSLNLGAGRDELSAGAGNDTLNGGSGHDKQWGGMGKDTVAGGKGNDTLRGDRGTDSFEFADIDHIGRGIAKDVITDVTDGLLRIDVDGDGRPDGEIALLGVPSVQASDFSFT